jgi:predicted ABC-type ATPase
MEPGTEKPTLYVFAGPNGAGKSTLFEQVKDVPQVNADVIKKENPELSAIAVGVVQARQMKELADKRETFSLETNLAKSSHYSLFKDYQEKGYRVEVTYVSLQSVELCKQRVAARVEQGGHNIPEKQIEERYAGGLEALKKNYQVPDRIELVDNTRQHTSVLIIEQGKITQQAPNLPKWAADIRDHIRQIERAGPAPQQQFLQAAGPVVQGLREHNDGPAAARLEQVARFVEKVPYLAGLNKENTEQAIAAATSIPTLARSSELLQLRAATVALEQPLHERNVPLPGAAHAHTLAPTATQPQKEQAKEQFLQAVGPVVQGLREHNEGPAATRLQEAARFVEKVSHLGGSNREKVEQALTAAEKLPSLSQSKELGELKKAVVILQREPPGRESPGREQGGIER